MTYPNPYYLAAFVLTGDDGPAPRSKFCEPVAEDGPSLVRELRSSLLESGE
jgi:hypothetical protein